jgi:hypothetical protein
MVSKVMYAKIQSLKRQGLNRSDIADKLKLTRKTVGKYFKMNEAEFKFRGLPYPCLFVEGDPRYTFRDSETN